MAKFYMIRHGRAAAGWAEDRDPGLDDLGREQSEAVAQVMAKGPILPIISSPMKRCRETSQPLCKLWRDEARIVKAVAEIPSPTPDLEARTEWLMKAMAGNWSALDQPFLDWRDNVVKTLLAIETDTVIFSHYIAINAAIGNATGDDRLVCFRPDNTSVHEFSNDGGKLSIVQLGKEAETTVN